MSTTTYTREEMALALTIWRAADDNDMVSGLGIAPHSRPELHGQMLAGSLFQRMTGKEWDADYFNDRFA